MSEDRDHQAEIEALQNRVENFWHKVYDRLHVLHAHAAGALHRTLLNDSDDSPGNNPRTPSPK